ncbi:MAG TPA: hypothetical protein VJN93_13155 [Candidatus Acidoferrum sp.]|nr:hypothetical protein [Candidatus Acidoferrum sp.]
MPLRTSTSEKLALAAAAIPMRIREYRASDLAALRALHSAQGFPYAFPDLRNPLFVTKLVLADSPASGNDSREGNCDAEKSDKSSPIRGAALLRLTAEAYLLLDPKAGTPRDRWNWLLALHTAAERDAGQRGLEDVHAWLPPAIAQKFGRRITQLGWRRDDSWTPYCKRLEVRD